MTNIIIILIINVVFMNTHIRFNYNLWLLKIHHFLDFNLGENFYHWRQWENPNLNSVYCHFFRNKMMSTYKKCISIIVRHFAIIICYLFLHLTDELKDMTSQSWKSENFPISPMYYFSPIICFGGPVHLHTCRHVENEGREI